MTIEPRPWITIEDLTDEDYQDVLCPLPEAVNDVAAQAGIDIATAVLYEMTGRRWSGSQTSSVRPCAEDTSTPFKVPGWVPSWGEFDSATGVCTPTNKIELGFFPVQSVLHVKIDGVTLSPSAYQLQDERYLVRVDGNDWPCDQNLSLPVTVADTFEVRIVHGIEPPEAGKLSCALYAAELAKSFCNLDCALPMRTQYMTRQGISTIMVDPLNVIFRGMVGLPPVDAWIRAVNPKGRRKRSMMVSGRNVPDASCRPPMSAARLGVDYYAYPLRGVNRFCGKG
jgi:hypothetical protein